MRNLRIMVGILALALLPGGSAWSAAAPGQPAAATDIQGLDAYIGSALKEWKVPGLAIAVIRDGRVAMAKGYGHRDVEKGLPVTPRTLFAIGSNSKSFTVTLLGMLNDEKKLEWDKPVREYLPDFRLYDQTATEQMTPRDLVSHRSGLPRHDLLWLASGMARPELYHRLRYLQPSRPFRSWYQYQNLMFMTAGYLEEEITGKKWEELVAERIFRPLGMQRSNLSVTALQRDSDFSLPYAEVGDKVERIPFRNIDAIGPAGSINSSAEEMARYIQFHIDLGKLGDKQLLTEKNARLMQTPQMIQPPGDVNYPELGPVSYGLGLAVSMYRGHKMVQHGGGIDGFISQMTWLPDDRIGCMVLTNYSGDNPVPGLVARFVVDRLLGLDPVDWAERTRDQQKKSEQRRKEARAKAAAERKTGTSTSHALTDYAGRYQNPGYGIAEVRSDGNRMTVRVVGLEVPLEHFHYDVFVVPEELPGPLAGLGGRRLVFLYNKKGEIDRLAIPLEPAVDDIVFSRAPAP